MDKMKEIREYWKKQLPVDEENHLTEAAEIHKQSSDILVGCIQQTYAQNEKDKKDDARNRLQEQEH